MESRRDELLLRRKQLQDRLGTGEFVKTTLEPYLEILVFFRQHNITYEIKSIVLGNPDWTVYLPEFFSHDPYLDYGFHVKQIENQAVRHLLDIWYDRFPSLNSFRYVPNLPRLDRFNKETVQCFLSSIGSDIELEQLVYLYHMQYNAVIELEFSSLVLQDTEELFQGFHGDVVIFPRSVDWILAFSLEEEWFAGIGGQMLKS